LDDEKTTGPQDHGTTRIPPAIFISDPFLLRRRAADVWELWCVQPDRCTWEAIGPWPDLEKLYLKLRR
jgi:hypothetical protein